MAQFKDKVKKIKKRNIISPNAGIDTKVRCDEPEHFREIIIAYKTAFGAGLGYKEPVIHTEPAEKKEGSMSISFPKKGDAERFFIDQAQKGMHMIILEEKNKVIAYSNGDSNLYHADGVSFQANDSFKPSNTDVKDFKVPEPHNGTPTISI